MQACLEDDQVESYDTSQIAVRGREFEKFCDKIKIIQCVPAQKNFVACSAYMSGAILAGFQMMGATHEKSLEVYGFKIDYARRMLKGDVEDIPDMNAERFIERFGETWYFCKCKPEKLEKCLKMRHALGHRCAVQ